MKPLMLLLILIPAINLPACSTPLPGRTIDPPNAIADAPESLANVYPPSFVSRQRAIVTMPDGQLTIDGMAMIQHNPNASRWQMIALTDLGTTAFKLCQTRSNQPPHVLANPMSLPTSLLLQGPARDLKALFLPTPPKPRPDRWRYQHEPDHVAGQYWAVYRLPNAQRHVYQFDNTGQWLGYREYQHDQLQYQLAIVARDQHNQRPRQVTIHNHRRHYRVQLQILWIKPKTLTDAQFPTQASRTPTP